MREATVEGYLKQQVEDRRGRCIKLVPWANVGLPDRLVLLPPRKVEFVETKTPLGRVRPGQRKWARILQGLGFEVHFIRTKGQVDLLMIQMEVRP